jgi:hypothetical protein
MKYLKEILDSYYPFRYVKHPNEHQYKFKTSKGKSLSVGIEHHKNKAVVTLQDEDRFGGGAFDAHGDEGHSAHKVYSTVGHIIKKHMEDHPHIESMHFDGFTTSQHKLYGIMLKHTAHKFGMNYDEESNPYGKSIYHIKKPNK